MKNLEIRIVGMLGDGGPRQRCPVDLVVEVPALPVVAAIMAAGAALVESGSYENQAEDAIKGARKLLEGLE
jgi:hypothetical protein